MLDSPDAWRCKRKAAFSYWHRRAVQLQAASIQELSALEDEHLRRLYLRGEKLGEFLHVALWREMAQSAKVPDC
eukprot:3191275-Amphidinium_carterae.1